MFLSHNFVSRCASKSIKGSKDSFSSHKSKKTLSEKNSHWAGGQAKLAENAQTCSHCDVTHKEPKKFFFDLKSKTCQIRRGFDQLSSSIGRQDMTGQSLGHYSCFAVLKGLKVDGKIAQNLKSYVCLPCNFIKIFIVCSTQSNLSAIIPDTENELDLTLPRDSTENLCLDMVPVEPANNEDCLSPSVQQLELPSESNCLLQK